MGYRLKPKDLNAMKKNAMKMKAMATAMATEMATATATTMATVTVTAMKTAMATKTNLPNTSMQVKTDSWLKLMSPEMTATLLK